MRGLLLACCLYCCSFAALAQGLTTWAYVPWWLPDSWRTLALEKFDRLLFFEVVFDAAGNITERNGWPDEWRDLRSAALQSRTPVDVTLRCSDAVIFNQVFASPDGPRRLLDQALALAAEPGVAGLHLDIEIYQSAQPAAIAAYRVFTRTLSQRLRQLAPARSLSVFFPMGADADVYDAPTLAQVDQVVLQGYDAHWLEGGVAGPVAPLRGAEAVTWEKAAARGLALGVPRERLLLSFPLYGYEWPVKSATLRSATAGKGRQTRMGQPGSEDTGAENINLQQRVRQYGYTYDTVSASSYYQFQGADGRLFEGWFDDWWTLERKIDFLKEGQLGGIAVFALGYDGGELVDYLLRRRGPRLPDARPASAQN